MTYESSAAKQERVTRIVAIVATAAVLIIGLGLTQALTISSFRQSYIENLVAGYSIPAGAGVGRVEYGIRYGKPIENFFGMEALLAEVKEMASDVSRVIVVDPAGALLYDERGPADGGLIASELRNSKAFQASEDLADRVLAFEGEYHLFIPIRGVGDQTVAYLGLVFSAQTVDAVTEQYAQSLRARLGLLAAIGLFSLLLVSRFVPMTTPEGALRTRRFMAVALVLLGVVQSAFSWSIYTSLSARYLETARANVRTVAAVVRQDIDSVIAKGVSYTGLYGLDRYLRNVASSVPEIAQIHVLGDEGRSVHSTGGAPEQDQDLLYTERLAPDRTSVAARLQVDISGDYIGERLREIFLDNLTVLAVSMVLMMEAVIFTALFLGARARGAATKSEGRHRLVRTVMLLLAVAVFMPSAFIPVLMKVLYQPILGLPQGVVLGLPISAEMLFAGMAGIVAGRMLDRGTWRGVFVCGIALFGLGLFMSYQAATGLAFIGARALSGAGYGCLLIALRGFVNAQQTEEARREGFSGYVSGLYAGFIVGVVIGALLADRIGFQSVFLVSLGVALLGAVTAVWLLPGHAGKARAAAMKVKGERSGRISTWRFLTDRSVVRFLGLIVIPLTVCSMFVDYFLPVYASEQGVSTSDVGRAFMLNGLAIAYVGPYLVRRIGGRINSSGVVAASGAMVVLALLVFVWGDSFWAAFVAALMLGLAESFGLVAQHHYYVGLKAAEEYGTGQAMGHFDNVRKVGQMAGPLTFGGALAWGAAGIGIIAAVALVATIGFYAVSRREGATVAG